MRLFVAVYPPAAAREHLAAALPAAPPGWRPVPPLQWHVTLAFLADLPAERLPELETRLARGVARRAAMTVALAGGGTFGGRVWWVGLTGELPALGRLADRVAAAVRRTGIPADDRPFRPHLTLARSRGPAPEPPPTTSYAGPSWSVREVRLVRSVVGGGPPAHETIRAFSTYQA